MQHKYLHISIDGMVHFFWSDRVFNSRWKASYTRKNVDLWLYHRGLTQPMRFFLLLEKLITFAYKDSSLPYCHSQEICCACTHHTVCYCCSVSLLSPVLSRFTRLARTRIVACLPACLRACLPACLCVFMSCSCTTTTTTTTSTTTTSLSPPSSEGYEKSRSLNNIAGLAGNALRLSPVTSPYGSPCPLRRSRSPIPSIL